MKKENRKEGKKLRPKEVLQGAKIQPYPFTCIFLLFSPSFLLSGALKMQDKTLQDRTMTDKLAGPDIVGQDNDGQTGRA